jgi:photosystem II stability/assembly factor-like uncharacterized protein
MRGPGGNAQMCFARLACAFAAVRPCHDGPRLRVGVLAWILLAGLSCHVAAARSWRRVLPPEAGAVEYVAHDGSGAVYAHAEGTLWASRDHGATWLSSTIHPVLHPVGHPYPMLRVAILPSSPAGLYTVVGGSLQRSHDAGNTWDAGTSLLDDFPLAGTITGVLISRADPRRIVTNTSHRGVADLYATSDDRATWTELQPAHRAPSGIWFVHPDTGKGYAQYLVSDLTLAEIDPQTREVRILRVALTGSAYGFDRQDAGGVLVTYAWARGAVKVEWADSGRHVDLPLPLAHPNGNIRSLAYDGATGAYYLALQPEGTETTSVIVTTDLGETWEDRGVLERDAWGFAQLHFLAGSPDIFLRTYRDWYRPPLGPIPMSGVEPATWAGLRSPAR